MAIRPMTVMGMAVAETNLSSTEQNAIAVRSPAFRIPGVLVGMIINRACAVFIALLVIGMRWRARRAAIASLNQMLKVEDHLLSDIGVKVIAAIKDLRATSLWRTASRYHRC